MTWAYRVVAALRAPIVDRGPWMGAATRKDWVDRYQAALMSYPGIVKWEDLQKMAITKDAITRRYASILALKNLPPPNPKLPRDVVRLITKMVDVTPPLDPYTVGTIQSARTIDVTLTDVAPVLTNYQLAYLPNESAALSLPVFVELISFGASRTSKLKSDEIRSAVVLWIFSSLPTDRGNGDRGSVNKALDQWMSPYLGSVNQIWNKLLVHIERNLSWRMRLKRPWTNPGVGSLDSTWFVGKERHSPTESGWVRPTEGDSAAYRRVVPTSPIYFVQSGEHRDRGDEWESHSSWVVPFPFRDI